MGTARTEEWFGEDPQKIAHRLKSFDTSCAKLSSDMPRLVEKYPDQWIGIHSGEVRAADEDLDTVLQTLDEQGVPRSSTVLRFIEKEPETLILYRWWDGREEAIGIARPKESGGCCTS